MRRGCIVKRRKPLEGRGLHCIVLCLLRFPLVEPLEERVNAGADVLQQAVNALKSLTINSSGKHEGIGRGSPDARRRRRHRVPERAWRPLPHQSAVHRISPPHLSLSAPHQAVDVRHTIVSHHQIHPAHLKRPLSKCPRQTVPLELP